MAIVKSGWSGYNCISWLKVIEKCYKHFLLSMFRLGFNNLEIEKLQNEVFGILNYLGFFHKSWLDNNKAVMLKSY